jgi:hypothetical protein
MHCSSRCFAAFAFVQTFSRAWACGLVPVAQTVAGNKSVLWDREQSVGLHYHGPGSCFQKINAPRGVQVTVFVDFTSKICKFCCNGVVVAIKPVPDAEFPLRLGICGHRGSVFNRKPKEVGDFKDESSKFECFMAAQVGDSVFPVQGPSQRHVSATTTEADDDDEDLRLALLMSMSMSAKTPPPPTDASPGDVAAR